MLTDAFQDDDKGIPIKYRFHGKLFNLRRLQAKIQGADRGARRVPLCWRHDKRCSNRREDAKWCRSSIWLLWQLWPHNPHQKDRGGLSSLTSSPPLQWKVKDCKWYTSSPTLEAHCQESCTLMMKSMPGLPKVVQHLTDYVVVFEIKVESGLTQSWKSTKLWCCQNYCMHAKRHAKRLNHFHTRCLRKLFKIKWQDRISDTEVLKTAGMQSVQTLLKLVQFRWTGPCYQDAWGTFAKENPLWRTRNGQTRQWWPEEAIQRHPPSKPPSKISTYLQSHGNILHRTEQNSEASSEEVLMNMRQKESAKSWAETCTAQSQS